MRIGIFIGNWNSHMGGGYSYINTLVEYFSNVSSSHEFVFIVAGNSGHPTDPSLLSNYILYNPYVLSESNKEVQRRNLRILNSLNRLIKIFNFLINKIKLNSLALIRDAIDSRKLKYQETNKKDGSLFKRLIKEENIGCVYYPMAFACEDPDVPFYTTIWDLGHLNISVFPEVSRNGEFEIRQNILNTIIHRAYRIVSESKSGRDDICFYYNTKPEKVIIVPQFPSNLVNIVLDDVQSGEFLKKNGLTYQEYLFYPAQFWPHKNHVNLIRALIELKKDGVTIDLVLTGSDKGNYQYVMNYLKTTSVADQVKYLGFVTDEEMKILYTNAMALVFPTLLGPTNMPIIEAIACGCPVVCGDFPGHKEQAQNAALYFKPDDIMDIKKKINTIIENPALRMELRENGLELYSKNKVEDAFSDLLISFDEFEKIRYTWEN